MTAGRDDFENQTRFYCDLWRGYDNVHALGLNVIRVNHAVGWGFGHSTTNHIESFWSILKDVCIFNDGYNCTNL